MSDAPATRAGADLFRGPYGLRAGWRIAMYLVLMLALMMVLSPLARLAGVSNDPLAGSAVALIGALGAGWAMMRWIEGRPFGALGFAVEPAAVRHSVGGTLVGGAMLGAAVLLLALAGTARWVAEPGSATEYVAALAGAFAFFAVAAALEEVLFRGYAFQALVQGIGVWPTLLLTSAGFAALHANNPSVTPVALANIFLAGIMLGVAYLRTRSLWFATAVHLGWNWFMAAVLDFPVSGIEMVDTPFYDARETGADWWTGGPFGPEAGLAATIAIAAGTAWLWRTRSIGESARMRALRPLVDARMGTDPR